MLKKILLLLSFLFVSTISFAQDLKKQEHKPEFKAQVIEVSKDTVKIDTHQKISPRDPKDEEATDL
jgi:hypothetical protein